MIIIGSWIMELTGRDLDAAVIKALELKACECWFSLNTGPNGECERCGFPYLGVSTDIAAAWQVKDEIHKRLFSVRMRFLEALQAQTAADLANVERGAVVAWPDVFWFVTPERICRAALLALEGE